MSRKSSKIRNLVLALVAVTATAGALAAPAMAADWGYDRGHPVYHWRDHWGYGPVVYADPYAVVAPATPVVIPPPAPTIVAPAPALSVVIPLHIR